VDVIGRRWSGVPQRRSEGLHRAPRTVSRPAGTRSVEEAHWATGAVRNRSVPFFPSSFGRTGKGKISQIRSEPSRSHAGVSVDIPLPRPPRASLGLTRFGRVLGPSVRLELSAGAASPGTAPHPALRGRGHRVVDEVGRLRSPAVRRTLSLSSSFTAGKFSLSYHSLNLVLA
jgi:hypothetical protein